MSSRLSTKWEPILVLIVMESLLYTMEEPHNIPYWYQFLEVAKKKLPMVFIVFVLAARNSVEGLLRGSFAFIQPLAGPALMRSDETRMLAAMASMWAKKWESGFSAFQTQFWIDMGSLFRCISQIYTGSWPGSYLWVCPKMIPQKPIVDHQFSLLEF